MEKYSDLKKKDQYDIQPNAKNPNDLKTKYYDLFSSRQQLELEDRKINEDPQEDSNNDDDTVSSNIQSRWGNVNKDHRYSRMTDSLNSLSRSEEKDNKTSIDDILKDDIHKEGLTENEQQSTIKIPQRIIIDNYKSYYNCPICSIITNACCSCPSRHSSCSNGHSWHLENDKTITIG